MRAHWLGVALAPLALAGCKVSYTSDDSAISAGRNNATGRFEANVKAEGRDIRIDAKGGEIRIGNETRVDLSNGEVRASIRTGENGSISINVNGQ